MRSMFPVSAMVLAAAILSSGAPVNAAGTCAAGGAMVMAQTDRDKTLAWARSRTRIDVRDNGATDWSVLGFSSADEGIGVLVEPGQVFFGVAGRGGETYPADMERAFGADRAKLRDAVAKTLAELVTAGAVKLEAGDVEAIAKAAGLGVLGKGADGWALTPQDCQAVDLPTSGL